MHYEGQLAQHRAGLHYPWGVWKNSWLLNTRTESSWMHFQSMSLHLHASKSCRRQLDSHMRSHEVT